MKLFGEKWKNFSKVETKMMVLDDVICFKLFVVETSNIIFWERTKFEKERFGNFEDGGSHQKEFTFAFQNLQIKQMASSAKNSFQNLPIKQMAASGKQHYLATEFAELAARPSADRDSRKLENVLLEKDFRFCFSR